MATINELKQKQEELKKQKEALIAQEKQLKEELEKLERDEIDVIMAGFPGFNFNKDENEVYFASHDQPLYVSKNLQDVDKLRKVMMKLQEIVPILDYMMVTGNLNLGNMYPGCTKLHGYTTLHHNEECMTTIRFQLKLGPTISDSPQFQLIVNTSYDEDVFQTKTLETSHGLMNYQANTADDDDLIYHDIRYETERTDVSIGNIIDEQLKLLEEFVGTRRN